MVNWKIVFGGLLIFGGITQFLRLFTEYRYKNTLSVSVGLGFLFVAITILGFYLLRQGRKESD